MVKLSIDGLIEVKEEQIEDIISATRVFMAPLDDDPAWRMLEEPDDWGVDDASERVDEYLYGG